MNERQTDLDLLKLAAQAASMDVRELPASYPTLWHVLGPDEAVVWNPLADDGQALRLSVALRLDILHDDPRDNDAWVMVGDLEHVEDVDGEASRPAATRRAIVRAAAAIRALKG